MKYVVVTGASGGMGLAVVKQLLQEGYYVFALDKKVDALENLQGNLIAVQVDVTDSLSIERAKEKIAGVVANSAEGLYALLHFAGVYMLDSLIETSEQSFQKLFDVNFFGVFRINKIFFPLLRQGSKIVIATSELAPLAPLPFTGMYAISKTALDNYAYSLRMEVQLKGVSVVVLRPGAVKTDMLGVSTDQLQKFCDNTQLYECNAQRFKKVVDGVEAKNISPQKVAKKTSKILRVKRPKYVYKINRNPLLLILNALPKRLQTFVIKKILK